MNLCILTGIIISDIQFKFIIKSKNRSIVCFDMKLLNKSVIKVKAYNKNADYIYRKFKKEQILTIEGRIRSDGSIEVI